MKLKDLITEDKISIDANAAKPFIEFLKKNVSPSDNVVNDVLKYLQTPEEKNDMSTKGSKIRQKLFRKYLDSPYWRGYAILLGNFKKYNEEYKTLKDVEKEAEGMWLI